MDGFDTGFFHALRAGNERAVSRWRSVIQQEEAVVVSSITIFEVRRHRLQGRLDRAARISHGMGLAMADALIAALLEEAGCECFYTGDSDFENYEGTMEVVFLT